MTNPSANDENYQVALDNCAAEPVHIPGRVQSFAAVLGVSRKSNLITHVSDNFSELTGLGELEIGQEFYSSFENRELVHEIRGALGLPTIESQRERLGQFTFSKLALDVAVHATDESVVIEFERTDYPAERASGAVSQVRQMLSRVHASGGVDEMMESAIYALRHTTGFDRVMAYRFLPNFEGEVVAEKHSPGLEPYLGLRYPASDIPTQVRDSMLRMPFRCIADIDKPEPVLLAAPDAGSLDLTLTHCKGVSPIHCEYLRNMGVRSTMNIPIIREGELWGLFALHHRRPKLLSPALRTICELFGYFFSMELQQSLQQESLSRRRRAASLMHHLEKDEVARQPLVQVVEQLSSDLLKLVDADGLALLSGDEYVSYASSSNREAAADLVDGSKDDLFAVDNLAETLGYTVSNRDQNVTSGALVVVLDRVQKSALLFFRSEEVSKVRWAGNPEKRIEFGPNGPRLHPRASFDEYIESIRGRSRPWHESQIAAASELRGALLAFAFRGSAISSSHWRQEKQRQELLIAELNHRVKNTLALVRAIAKRTKASAVSLEEYTLAFEKRISALASAHDLVGGSGLQWAPLQTILNTELRPYIEQDTRCQISGPPASIKSDVAPVLSLVVHELVTNAAKHGALSGQFGRLEVRWATRDGGLEIIWREALTQPLSPPNTEGFGLTLIKRTIPHECDGETEVNFRSEGIDVSIWLPSETVQFSGSDVAFRETAASKEQNVPQQTGRALVLEDSMVVAMELEETILQWGCESVDTVGNVDDALHLVREHRYDLAILDINLGRTSSFPIANELVQQGVPLVFVSGYGESFPVPESLQAVPILAKPFETAKLAETLTKVQNGT